MQFISGIKNSSINIITYGRIQYFLFFLRCWYNTVFVIFRRRHDCYWLLSNSNCRNITIALYHYSIILVCRTHNFKSYDILLGNYIFRSRQRRVVVFVGRGSNCDQKFIDYLGPATIFKSLDFVVKQKLLYCKNEKKKNKKLYYEWLLLILP